MERSSKYNPYECPECGHKSTRKWNMKVHLERAHGLAPFLPERSTKEWVYAQLYNLTRQYAEAEVAGDKERCRRLWNSLISLYGYHRGLFHIGRIPELIAEERKRLLKQMERQQEQ
jgi:hypothetical protein